MRPFDRLVVTCEHGGNRIPPAYRDRFRGAAPLLETHRGYDIGALGVARALARRLDAPVFFSTVSRLLVDLNRSEGHRRLFSKWMRHLASGEKDRLLDRYYRPYRTAVQNALDESLRGGRRVLHLSIHSFTPVMDGRARSADLGLLYDPARRVEREFAARFRRSLRDVDATLRVRRNHPYRGVSDGFTTHLRRALGSARYAGIEIEMNQAGLATAADRRRMAAVLAEALVG